MTVLLLLYYPVHCPGYYTAVETPTVVEVPYCMSDIIISLLLLICPIYEVTRTEVKQVDSNAKGKFVTLF